MTSRVAGVGVFALLIAVGCSDGKDAAPQVPEARPGAGVAKVVVLEQGECCECTRARQETTWENLQAALERVEEKPDVDVIHFDAEPEAAQPYRDMKPVVVSPALYFLDGDGALVDTLQGEQSVEAVAALLAREEATDED